MTRAGEAALSDLFDAAGVQPGDEVVSLLAEAAGVRIERIVSPPGHASPAGFWFDQGWPEWVAVLAGEAGLLLEGEPEPRRLPAGASLLIAPGRRHRIAWTDAAGPTIWLAVHLPPGDRTWSGQTIDDDGALPSPGGGGSTTGLVPVGGVG